MLLEACQTPNFILGTIPRIYQDASDQSEHQLHPYTARIVASDSWISDDLGWCIRGKWGPNKFPEVLIRGKSCLWWIPWATFGSENPSEVTLYSRFHGSYAGGDNNQNTGLSYSCSDYEITVIKGLMVPSLSWSCVWASWHTCHHNFLECSHPKWSWMAGPRKWNAEGSVQARLWPWFVPCINLLGSNSLRETIGAHLQFSHLRKVWWLRIAWYGDVSMCQLWVLNAVRSGMREVTDKWVHGPKFTTKKIIFTH